MAIPVAASRWFSALMGLTVAVIVFYGFGHTVDRVFIHYNKFPPPVLYVHLLISSTWLFLFVVQSGLVSSRNTRLHRTLGVWGLALGTAVSVVGLITVYTMRYRHIDAGGGAAAEAFFAVPLFSLASFAVPFFMAAWWRAKPQLHRRLMMLATCSLSWAALARVPWLGDKGGLYITDLLFLIAAGVDWRAHRRIHRVYLIGIAAMIIGQFLCLYLATAAPHWWVVTAAFLLGRPPLG